MRIAHVISTFPPRVGGMGNVCYEEAKRLAERGHDVTVFTLRYGNENLENLPFKLVRLRPWLRSGDAGWTPLLFWKLRGFDLVHLHYPYYGGAHSVLFAKLFRKQKYVLTYHMDAAPVGWFKKLARWKYDLLFSRAILRDAKKIILVDKDYKPELNGIEIPNAVDTETFKIWGKAPAFSFGKKIVLFAANPMPLKRLDLMINAFTKIDDAILLVVGGGYDLDKYKKMAESLGIKEKILFAGRCEDKSKMVFYYNLAWCLAIPSESESFSLAAIEAMACGCPVLAREIPGLRGRIRHGIDGWLTKAETPEQWADAIRIALDTFTEIRKKMGAAGREKVCREYCWNEHINKLEKAYGL